MMGGGYETGFFSLCRFVGFSGCLPRGRDILGSAVDKDFLGSIGLLRCFTTNRDQDAALQQLTLVSLGLVLGNP